jgi:hypothetical protein
MRNSSIGRGIGDRSILLAALLVVCAALGASCGDDDEPAPEPSPKGEACKSPGLTEVGCMCSASQPPGSRHCNDDHIYSACVCPPASSQDRCSPGQEIRCFPCPGEIERRITMCLGSGTFDCSCGGSHAGSSAPATSEDAGL